MSFSFDSYLGVHETALHVRSRRAQILASNIANVNTPNFKARDIDFTDALRNSAAGHSAKNMTATHSMHIQAKSLMSESELKYRNPYQDSLDGNTVEHQVEMAAYSDNAMRYLANLRILTGKFNTLRTAIKGQ